MRFSKKINNNNTVYLSVFGREVTFSINGRMQMRDDLPKITITKWLIKTFNKEIKGNFDYLITEVYNKDGNGKYREAIYKKIGFRNIPGSKYLIYGKHWMQLPITEYLKLIK